MSDEIKVPEVSQEVLDEALLPERSTEFFEFAVLRGNKRQVKVQVKPLMYRYTNDMAKILSPIMDELAFEATTGSQIQASAKLLKYGDELAQMIVLLCKNDEQEVSLDDVLDSDLDPVKMGKVLAQYAQKIEGVEKLVQDFFMPALQRYKGLLKQLDNALLEKLATLKAAVEELTPEQVLEVRAGIAPQE
jgi:hypothetical protein